MSKTLRFPFVSAACALALAGCGAFENDNDGDDDNGDTNPPPAHELTVADIQDESSEYHPAVDSTVELKGKIVTALAGGTNDGFFISDPEGGEYSGIYVYTATLPAGVEVGAEVTVQGTYTEYRSSSATTEGTLSEISPSTDGVTVTATGLMPPVLTVPAAEIGTLATNGSRAEALEGVLVQIDGTVTVGELLGYGEFSVENAAGDALRVDDFAFVDAEVGKVAGQEITLLRGVLHFAFDDFKLLPRGEQDLVAGAVPLRDVSIYQIQDRADAEPALLDTGVRLTGVVVTAVRGDGSGAFFVQVPEADRDVARGAHYSGIYVYRASGGTPVVAVGDVVTIEGAYTEYPVAAAESLSQIAPTAVTVTSSGAPVPAPVLIADPTTIATNGADAEKYESVLVRVEAVTVTDPNPDDTTDPPDDFGEFVVAGVLRVDDLLFSEAEVTGRAAIGEIDFIQGPLYFGNDNFKLEPRNADDIGAVTPPVPDATVYQIQDRGDAAAVALGTTVRLTGLVVTAVRGTGNTSFFAQVPEAERDPARGAQYSGIYVYRSSSGTPVVAVGDVVTIEGVYTEYPEGAAESLSQIAPTVITITASGAAVPAPVLIADPASIATNGADAEKYESVLVRVENVTVVTLNPDDPSDWSEFEVTGNLRVDDMLYANAETTRAVTTEIEFIQGPLYFANDNFKLEPRSAEDIGAAAAAAQDVTVYQIQDRGDAAAVASGTLVRVTDLVVTAVKGVSFFAQIPDAQRDTRGAAYSGISVYRSAGSTPVVAVGDVVTVEGVYSEYNDVSQISASGVTITTAGGTPAAPVLIADPATIATDGADAEAYESVFVRLEGVSLVTENPDDPSDFGEFTVTGNLRVDDYLYASAEADGRAKLAPFNIQGIHYFGYGNYKLLPRFAADIE